MIDVTGLIKSLDDLDIEYIYQYDQALQGKYHYKNGKWFDNHGKFVGNNAEDVCKRFGLSVTKLKPHTFIAVEPQMIEQLVNKPVVLINVHGTHVVGLHEGGMSAQELDECLNQ